MSDYINLHRLSKEELYRLGLYIFLRKQKRRCHCGATNDRSHSTACSWRQHVVVK